MDQFKLIPKMKNPAIVVVSNISMNEKGWKLVYRTIKLMTGKLLQSAGLTLEPSIQDLMDNISNECTNEEHELAEFSREGCGYYICVHCLLQFKMAKAHTRAGFLDKGGS